MQTLSQYLYRPHAPDCDCSVCFVTRLGPVLLNQSMCADCQPPWAPLSARWPLALPSPFLLREARPKLSTAEVLARCLRQRQADSICSHPRTLRVGGLNHGR
nr:DUF5447 family protein [Pseudomonas aeruginosa]